MSSRKVTIENHGNVYLCCKCCCVCGKGCKCEDSKCLIKINEHSGGKVMIGKKSSEKSSSMQASKEQVEQFIAPPHRTICLDCKGGCEDDKMIASRSRSRSKRSGRQSEQHRSLSAGSSPTTTAREVANLDRKFGLDGPKSVARQLSIKRSESRQSESKEKNWEDSAEKKNGPIPVAKRLSIKSGESSRSASKEKTLEGLLEKSRKSRRSASKDRLLEHELEKSGEFKRSASKDRVLEELLENSRKSAKSSGKKRSLADSSFSVSTAQSPSSLKNSRRSKHGRTDSSFSASTAKSPSLSDRSRKSKRRSSKKQSRVDYSSVAPAQSPIFLNSKVELSEKAQDSSQRLVFNESSQPVGKIQGRPRLFGTSEEPNGNVQELRHEEIRDSEAESETSDKSGKKLRKKSRSSKKSSRSSNKASKKSRDSNKSDRSSKKKRRSSKSSTKVATDLRKADRDLANQVNVQELAANEVVTARESKSLTNVNRQENVRGSSMSETSIDAENVERKVEGNSVYLAYLAPQMDSGRSKRLDVPNPDRQNEVNQVQEQERSEKSESERKVSVTDGVTPKIGSNRLSAISADRRVDFGQEQRQGKEESSERKADVSGGVAPKIGGEPVYLAPKMDSGRSNRLDVVSSDRQDEVNRAQERVEKESSEQKANVADEAIPKIAGESIYLAPPMESKRLFGVSTHCQLNVGQESAAKLESERKVNVVDEVTPKIGGESVYLAPSMDSGRSNRLDLANSDRQLNVSQENGQESAVKLESERKVSVTDEVAPKIAGESVYLTPKMDSGRSKRLSSVSPRRQRNVNKERKRKSSKKSRSERKIEGNSTPKLEVGRSNRLSAVGSEKQLGVSQESVEKLESGQKASVSGESTYLNPQVGSDRSKYLPDVSHALQINASHSKERLDKESSERKIGGESGQLEVGRSNRLYSERKANVCQDQESAEKEGSERKVKIEGDSTYLAPTMDSGRSKRLDASNSDRKRSVSKERKRKSSKKSKGERKISASGRPNSKIAGKSVYLTPEMGSGRSKRLSVASSERNVDSNRAQEQVKEEISERKVKVEGNSAYLAPTMDSGRSTRLDASGSEQKMDAKKEQESSEKAESERKIKIEADSAYLNPKMESDQDNSKRLDAPDQKIGVSQGQEKMESERSEKSESERKVKVEDTSAYLAPQMDSGRLKRLDASDRKVNASQGKESSEKSASESMEQSGSESSERSLNVSDGSEYVDPQLRSGQSDRLFSERHLDISRGQDDSPPKGPRKSTYLDHRMESLENAKRSSSKRSERKMETHRSHVSDDGSKKTEESNDAYYLQKKKVNLVADVDGAPVNSSVTLNIKTRKKDSKVEMREMWVDGKRVFRKRSKKE